MNLIENIHNLKEFTFAIGCEPDRDHTDLHVTAFTKQNSAPLIDQILHCYFFTDKYLNPVINIDWDLTETMMKELGLYIQYNTRFQEFYYDSSKTELTIIGDNNGIEYRIVLTSP